VVTRTRLFIAFIRALLLLFGAIAMFDEGAAAVVFAIWNTATVYDKRTSASNYDQYVYRTF
jgi:hypothetical protein